MAKKPATPAADPDSAAPVTATPSPTTAAPAAPLSPATDTPPSLRLFGVTSPLLLDGRFHRPGGTVALTADQYRAIRSLAVLGDEIPAES